MQTYMSSLSSPLMQDGACGTSIQAAAGMQGPCQWCKDASKPCFAKWLCDGQKTWESWDAAKQGGRLGKSPFCHQDNIETSKAVGDAPAETQQRVSSNQGLGSTYFALFGGAKEACAHTCLSPQPGAEKGLWVSFSSPGQPDHRDLPQRGMLWESEPEYLLGSWHSLPSCCHAWWEDGGDFIYQCCPSVGSWCAWVRGWQSASARPQKHHRGNNAGQILRSISNCCYCCAI